MSAEAQLFGAKTYGFWTVIGPTDATGKRLLCRCACSTTCIVSIEALTSGASTSCGCRRPTLSQHKARAIEAAEQRRRAILQDWRPAGRS